VNTVYSAFPYDDEIWFSVQAPTPSSYDEVGIFIHLCSVAEPPPRHRKASIYRLLENLQIDLEPIS
jgi:hypothetical protein